jgi:trk system potassium uptake protein TrkA
MKIVIAGAGAVGTHMSKLLSRDHQDCVLIDAEASRLAGLDGR